jgi:hypothetical protein
VKHGENTGFGREAPFFILVFWSDYDRRPWCLSVNLRYNIHPKKKLVVFFLDSWIIWRFLFSSLSFARSFLGLGIGLHPHGENINETWLTYGVFMVR